VSPAGPENDATFADILHPPDYRPRALHIVLVSSYLLGQVSPLALMPAWLALAAIASWPWADLRIVVAGLSVALTLLDGIGLALLPRLGRSFGPVTPPLLALTLVRTSLTLAVGLLWNARLALMGLAAVQLAIAGICLYATWIEPFRIGVTEATLRSPKLTGSAPLRLLHVSDLHVERVTSREQDLLDLVAEIDPDLIVLTGDYLNLSSIRDSAAHAEVRDLLAELCERARSPIYAITGSPPVDLKGVIPRIFTDLPIRWLLDSVADLCINGHAIRLVGLRCTRERSRDAPRLRRLLGNTPGDAFTLLLYHSPDLMPEAVELGVDLYLCGHTHGGQIRLPLVGALVTSSDFWKRYEMGRYEEKGTTLYVSRGLGMEGLGAPRARFLAPPEVILWTLSTTDKASWTPADDRPRQLALRGRR
jgi:predicted MPP superfamily phosphohydrolase